MSAFSQEKKVGGFIDNDIVFYSDTTYIIESNMRISSESELVIMPNAVVLMNSGVSVIVDGSLKILGQRKNPVKIQSADADFQALGFVIGGFNNDSVEISYCHFSTLLLPLRFKDGWFRNNVTIQYSEFKEIHTNQYSIYIGDLSKKSNTVQPKFSFTHNSFVENNSTIYLSNFESDQLSMIFRNNLITSNYIIDSDDKNPLNAVFSGSFNQNNFKHTIVFEDNSIFDNYLISDLDYTKNKELNLGVSGEGESIIFKNNFIGNPQYSETTLVHFDQNKNLPNIQLEQLQVLPSNLTPPHIWKVQVKDNNNWVDWNTYNETSNTNRDYQFKLFFNKSVSLINDDALEFYTLNSTIDTFKITPVFDSISDNWIQFSISDINVSNGSLVLPSAIDSDGVLSPQKRIGNINSVFIYEQDLLTNFLVTDSINNNVVSDDASLLIKNTDNIKEGHRFHVGTLLGSNYFVGDAIQSNFELTYGTFVSYVLNELIEFQGTYKYSLLQNKFPSNYNEDVSLRTDINSLSVRVNYNLFNVSNTLTIDFFLGFGLLNFQPKGEYQGYYYNLKKLRTEGEAYRSNTFFTPFGVSVSKEIFKDFFIAFELAYEKTFTDYLDDISGNYVDYNTILNENGDIAAFFSDPSRVNPEYDFQKNGSRGNTLNSDNLMTVLFSIGKKIK